jgi:stress-induced morphogen
MPNPLGGCGSFYAIAITSPAFKGLTTIKQHRMVTEELKKEIGEIHGLQVRSVCPQQSLRFLADETRVDKNEGGISTIHR